VQKIRKSLPRNPFPFAPALSVNPNDAIERHSHPNRSTALPLPGGEGRGEGEARIQLQICFALVNASRRPEFRAWDFEFVSNFEFRPTAIFIQT
jgi:hypothetical protein